MKKTRYLPTENGFFIKGSSEVFNRTLYGSHKNDDKSARFFTFAGDSPLFMAASTDWKENLVSFYSKCGTLFSGLCLTKGQRIPFFYSDDIDISSRWFHNSEDVACEFENGYMKYELSQMSPWFPDVNVKIEAYPLLPDDGFLINYKIKTDQRVVFVAGFGGLTDYIGRFEYKDEKKRYFHTSDCKNNIIKIKNNCGIIKNKDNCSIIGTSFDSKIELGSGDSLSTPYPSTFLASTPQNADDNVIKISTVIDAGKELNGYIVVLHNESEAVLKKWLNMSDPIKYIKGQIYEKHSCILLNTPNHELDLTIAPTTIALDSSYHKNSFHHGAFGYHSPFLGWRNWYSPTILGWNDRVEKVISTHLSQLVKDSKGKEKVWFDGENPREGDGPSQYHSIENSTGYLPFLLGEKMAYYNMQECALDEMMYYIEWTGNFSLAKKYFDDFSKILDWENRILDYDNDGLYQNFLNTWISDGHSYNGAGCAQASAYNYRANLCMAKIAEKISKPSEIYKKRAEKIKKAVNNKLWLKDKGIIAESIDTVGNCLIHPSPELSTTYLCIDCGIVDDFKAYCMLKYTENNIKSIETQFNGGRLSYSSNWLPKKYSTCGIFPSENAHLALAYFKVGLVEEGNKILQGIVDCYFTSKNPGMAPHVQSSLGTGDLADLDFTDVSSTYLRAVTEGLFGIKINNLDDCINISPNFKNSWETASLSLKDISLYYNRKGKEETYEIYTDKKLNKIIKIPIFSNTLECVLLNNERVEYSIEPAINRCNLVVKTGITGRNVLKVVCGEKIIPSLKYSKQTFTDNTVSFEVVNGDFIELNDISNVLDNVEVVGNIVYGKVKAKEGKYTLFIHVKNNEFEAFIPADFEVLKIQKEKEKISSENFEPIDISNFFNCEMNKLHSQKFMSPRPKGYSIGVFPNGRYAWEWNHKGHNELFIDDSAFRNSNGIIYSQSKIPFLTPEKGDNLACVSIWDNFPTEIKIPVFGKAKEIALMFVSTTNSMQTAVENVRIKVNYKNGESKEESLVYPKSIDDFLVPALQTENETFYFNDYNHATIKKISLNCSYELESIKIEAVANEVIFGLIGLTVAK